MEYDDHEEVSIEPNDHDIFIGSVFLTKHDLLDAVGQYHVHNVGEHRTIYSCSKRYTVQCAYSEDCEFTIKARGAHGVWRIIEHTPHNCSTDPRRGRFRKAGYKEIGTYFSKLFLERAANFTPKAMQEEVRLRFQIDINYDSALRAKHYAMERIYGDMTTSFNQVPSYLWMLESTNPGTVTNLELDYSTRKFENAFYALGASIEGFRHYGRPIIVVDGSHLKGKYKGVLFVVVTQDGNRQVFPLAVGIGHVEEDLTWTYFMENLKNAYGSPPNLVIVSDGHQSISNAIKAVFPDAQHCLCYFHLKKNLNSFGQAVLVLFRNVAYAFSTAEYVKYMTQLQSISGAAFAKLMELGPDRWARSQCPRRRYEFMTSNAVESFNSRALGARELPITSAMEALREVMEHWFYERRTVAMADTHSLTHNVRQDLATALQKSASYRVSPLKQGVYKVKTGEQIRIVDLNAKTCDCRMFDEMLMSCTHAAAVIRSIDHDITTYVDVRYNTSHMRGLWGGAVMPIPDPREWTVPDFVKELICLPPDNRPQAGRPRKSRYEAGQSSSQRSNRCSQSSADGEVNRKRAPKKCMLCGSQEHTRRKFQYYTAPTK